MSKLFDQIDQNYLTRQIIKRFNTKLDADTRISTFLQETKAQNQAIQPESMLFYPGVEKAQEACLANETFHLIRGHLIETLREFGLSENIVVQARQMISDASKRMVEVKLRLDISEPLLAA